MLIAGALSAELQAASSKANTKIAALILNLQLAAYVAAAVCGSEPGRSTTSPKPDSCEVGSP
jgi:hypothetical protein